ncbi:hypothetical protein RA280_34930 [Cupriavidus sp. CV2]|uniref:hypothetical protein n=1 Tax=Cupriavidus ulmosensis TaxID=3065913 RepID=UPI00296B4E5F|nr:hypothetical protein [Cupriavidus sp. CV2]MDW3686845.1 hypothetical protein [Cupriavidus sp. CV2]
MVTNEVEQRNLLITGAYGVLGTGITDAALADPAWRVITAARRSPPTRHFAFLDACLNLDEDVVLSTVKLVQAGFTKIIVTRDSLRQQILRLREIKLVP